jgi:hypothetical protein
MQQCLDCHTPPKFSLTWIDTMKKIIATVSVIVATAITGCTSMTTALQTNDDLINATSRALGTLPADLLLAKRIDEGANVSYDVIHRKTGLVYSCSRTVAVEKSKPSCKAKTKNTDVASDSALLKSAGY